MGNPKGVATTVRDIVALAHQPTYCEIASTSAVLQYAPISFDAATFEIWGALLNGAKIAITPKGKQDLSALKKHITSSNIAAAFLTTRLFVTVVNNDLSLFSGIAQILVGGEIVSPIAVKQVKDAFPNIRIIHCYGPTETTVYAVTAHITVEQAAQSVLPLGKPIQNYQAYILDKCLKPMPIGYVGELYIAGAGLARGYLGRPGLTSERFIANPFTTCGSRMYRTGDLARWREDGNLEYVGRSDNQVKIRGFRVELGEIESALSRISGVSQVSVQLREFAGDKRLVAYLVGVKSNEPMPVPDISSLRSELLLLSVPPLSTVEQRSFTENVSQRQVADHGGSAMSTLYKSKLPSVSQLRAELAQTLPDYMIPTSFIELDEFPLTANGKLNVHLLPTPEIVGESEYRAPRSPTEILLCDLYKELTGASRVGLDDNFFGLGGHSLLAMRLVARIREILWLQAEMD